MSQKQHVHPIQLDQIVLFGDSITQQSFHPGFHGWGAVLANAYVRKLEVVNRGFSGYTTEWCKHLLPSVLESTLPPTIQGHSASIQLVTVFLGANDAVLPGQRQHVPLDDYKRNLKELVEQIQANNRKTRVILITPPPVDPTRWSTPRHTEPDRSVENTKKYRDFCLEVAQELCIVALDTWELFLGPSLECTPATTRDLLNDGLHFDTKGNQLLGSALLETIKKNWPELEPEGMKSLVAWHDQVDKTDLPKTLFRFDRAHGGGL